MNINIIVRKETIIKERAPNFTSLLLTWIVGKDMFRVKDFMDDNPSIQKELLDNKKKIDGDDRSKT